MTSRLIDDWRMAVYQEKRGEVRRLASSYVAEVVEVLCESFFDYPVMRFVVGSRAEDYERKLETLINFFVMARVFRGETMLGIGESSSLGAVALVSRPDGSESPPGLAALRQSVGTELGDGALARYEAFGRAWTALDVDVPQIHLNMIGVRREGQGKGLGRALIEHVHHISRLDPNSEGVTLTTENEANVTFYEHLGYEVIGQKTVAPGIRTWGFFRPD